MPVTFLTTALLIVSLLTNLTVEAVKKLLDGMPIRYSSNVLAAILSVLISGGVCAVYQILSGLPFSSQTGMEMVLLMYLSFLVSTVGYDKVVQTIKQIQTFKEDWQ